MNTPYPESVLELASRLIEQPSITPRDEGCQILLGERLTDQGFHIEGLGRGEVENLWAVRGSGAPLVMLAGHTDVVPVGELDQWQHDPFVPVVDNGDLCGRGSADMKGSLAAMVNATGRFIGTHRQHKGTIAYLITSDEEGPAVNGTVKVVEHLVHTGIQPDYCLVGEPSSSDRLGDVIRIGRRGSLNGHLEIRGTQGHVAYPHLADNPIHAVAPLLTELTTKKWDEGNDQFPPTSLQISNIFSGTGATNVIPGVLNIRFNLRFSTEQTSSGLMQKVEAMVEDSGLEHHLDWELSGEPFLTPTGKLIDAVVAAIEDLQGITPELSTSGGTSDGRFIATMGCEVVELGPVNRTIHKTNERVSISDLDRLSDIYLDILTRLLID